MSAPRVEIDKTDAANGDPPASHETGEGMACLEAIVKMFPQKIRPRVLRSPSKPGDLVVMWNLNVDTIFDERTLLREGNPAALAGEIRSMLLGGIDSMIEQLYDLVEGVYPGEER